MRDALVALASRTGASVRPNMTVGELVDAVSMASQEASGKLQAAEESRDQARLLQFQPNFTRHAILITVDSQ